MTAHRPTAHRPTGGRASLTAALSAALLAGPFTLLAACSSDDEPAAAVSSAPPAAGSTSAGASAGTSGGASPSASASASASASPSAEPDINPCDGIDADAVARALGAALRKETGTVNSPRCALLPVEEGGPTFEMSYLWFDQGLEAAWRTMQVPAGQVSRPRVAGADDARVVVNASPKAYAVSAFLQNGALIQTVNALALPPYDGPRVRRAVQVLLAQLSAARADS